jgi:anti-sigma factor RsiW
MNCREFTEFLHDYLLGGLLAEVRAEFDRHLAECPWCVAYLDSYQKTMHHGKRPRRPSFYSFRPPEAEPLVPDGWRIGCNLPSGMASKVK